MSTLSISGAQMTTTSLTLFAKTEVNLSFGLKPDSRCGLSYGLRLQFKTKVSA